MVTTRADTPVVEVISLIPDARLFNDTSPADNETVYCELLTVKTKSAAELLFWSALLLLAASDCLISC